jgi:hypothetical protein
MIICKKGYTTPDRAEAFSIASGLEAWRSYGSAMFLDKWILGTNPAPHRGAMLFWSFQNIFFIIIYLIFIEKLFMFPVKILEGMMFFLSFNISGYYRKL